MLARTYQETAVAVHATLDAVVSAPVKEAILEAALADCVGGTIPADRPGFQRFLRGPFYQALAQGLGRALADTVMAELEADLPESTPSKGKPSLTLGTGRGSHPHARISRPPPPSGRHVRSPQSSASHAAAVSNPPDSTDELGGLPRAPSIPTFPVSTTLPAGANLDPLNEVGGGRSSQTASTVPPFSGPVVRRGGARPMLESNPPALSDPTLVSQVLVATRDRRVADATSRWLEGRCSVILVSDVLSLLRQLEAKSENVLIVVDCTAPSVRPLALAALWDDLPDGIRVLLWGAAQEEERNLLLLEPRTAAWARCRSLTPAELTKQCSSAVSVRAS